MAARRWLAACGTLLAVGGRIPAATIETDVAVYAATAGGVAAAVQATRMGKRAVLLEPGRHVGGLTSGGLGATDVGNGRAIGGLGREFYDRVKAYYSERYGPTSPQYGDCHGGYRFEPHVAEDILSGMLKEAGARLELGRRLLKVVKRGNRIAEITLTGDLTVRAAMFVDASYEGDLMAQAGVKYTVGREANEQYSETLNGRQFRNAHNFRKPVDPYRTPGDPTSGLLPGISAEALGKAGEGDKAVQAYNFRMCLTKAADRLPLPKPPGYDPDRYLLLLRYLEAGVWDALRLTTRMPNGKTDTNNHGAVSSDNIGYNHAYPDADYATREKIVAEHRTYQQGMMWFLANDERVPEEIRREVSTWGLPRDEFLDNGGWPHQLYVREARRMVAALVMTEHHCTWRQVAEDSVGLGSYGMDSHNCRRLVIDGVVRNEGDVQVGVRGPYPVSYRAIVPREEECANLFVPVCLSATHIAYGSIRMEPVFMILGQSAATAAAMAIDGRIAVQNVDYKVLRERLLADKQVLDWKVSEEVEQIDPKTLPGIVLDDAVAERTGTWVRSTRSSERLVGNGYVHENNADKGRATLTFKPELPQAGRYEVFLLGVPNANRASNVPVTITVPGRAPVVVRVDQRGGNGNGNGGRAGFVSLGLHDLPAGAGVSICVSNEGTNGFVVVDGLQLVMKEAPNGARP
jgi:hypothetical protein